MMCRTAGAVGLLLWLATGGGAVAQSDGALRALQSRPAPPRPVAIDGVWIGKYVCRQGVTGVQIVIADDGARSLFHFFGSLENPDVPEGCFRMSGRLDAASGRLDLAAGDWVVRPRNYQTVDVTATIGPTGRNLSGEVTGVPGCTTIVLSRAPQRQTMPRACARALE